MLVLVVSKLQILREGLATALPLSEKISAIALPLEPDKISVILQQENIDRLLLDTGADPALEAMLLREAAEAKVPVLALVSSPANGPAAPARLSDGVTYVGRDIPLADLRDLVLGDTKSVGPSRGEQRNGRKILVAGGAVLLAIMTAALTVTPRRHGRAQL
jgi:hypothetical protein